MADCENVNFCGTHGTVLGDDRVCEQCRGSMIAYWADHPNPPTNFEPGKKSDYLTRELRERNRTPWSDASWVKSSPGSVIVVYLCDHCSYFMHHQLVYCPTCGGRFRYEKLTYQTLTEKYAGYRRGY